MDTNSSYLIHILSPEDIWPFYKELSLLAVMRRNLRMASHQLHTDILLKVIGFEDNENSLLRNCSPLPVQLSCLGHPIFKKITNLGNASLIDLIACNLMQIRELKNTTTEKKIILHFQPDNPGLHTRQGFAHTALHPLPFKWVGQGHPYLCHTIPGDKQISLVLIPCVTHKIGWRVYYYGPFQQSVA